MSPAIQYTLVIPPGTANSPTADVYSALTTVVEGGTFSFNDARHISQEVLHISKDEATRRLVKLIENGNIRRV